jgi:predicted nucleic acid-binding Zn ribbon protein
MIASGRYLRCEICGTIYPEGCCRGTTTCTDECQSIKMERRKKHEEEVRIEIAAAEYRRCPNYQI